MEEGPAAASPFLSVAHSGFSLRLLVVLRHSHVAQAGLKCQSCFNLRGSRKVTVLKFWGNRTQVPVQAKQMTTELCQSSV